MRTNKRLITALSVFVLMLVTSIFCMTVFAEKTEEETETQLSALSTVVSGCDLKKEDLQMVKVKITGFSMLVPKGDVITLESESSVFEKAKMTYGFDRSTLIGENAFFYFNSKNENYCQVYAGFDEINPLDSYYGDYSKLTDDQKNELIAQSVSGDDSAKGRFEKINGRTYLMISKDDEDSTTGNRYSVYALYTVIGSYKYIVQVVAVNPNKTDLEVVNEMLNSVKLGGLKEPVSPLNIALIVCVVILLLAVAFAFFTLYRLYSFVKSGITNVPVFGFNLPERATAADDSEDDEENDEFDDDSDVDEDSEDDPNQTVLLNPNEKIVDDDQ